MLHTNTMNKYLASILTVLATFIFVMPVFADSFVLTHIGTMETKGVKYNQWWYEPQRVTLKGTGSKGANIDVTVDGKFNTTKASVEEGKWSYDLGNMEVADHSIVIGSGEDMYSFVLTIGSSNPADMQSATKGGLPEAGILVPLLSMITISGILIYFGFKKDTADLS